MAQTRVAVDAMGGDHGPAVVVEGALRASRAEFLAIERDFLPAAFFTHSSRGFVHSPT